MNKKIIIFGLVGTMLFSPVVQTYAAGGSNLAATVEVNGIETISLGLEEAIKYALENSRDMEIQRLELLKADVAYDEGLRNAKRMESNADDIPLRDPITGMADQDSVLAVSYAQFGVSRRSVTLAYQIAKWNIELKENQIKYNVEKAYFDLLQMEEELKIARENIELSEKQYKQAIRRYELGMISKQQLLALELGLLQAQSIYDTAKMSYDLQMMSFQDTLGLTYNTEIRLTDTLEYKEYDEIDLAKSIKLGLENNVTVKAAEEGYEVSKLTLKAISARYPEGTYRYREQAVEVEKAAKNFETAKKAVEMGVKTAYLNLQTAEKQIRTYEKSVEQAENAVRIAEVSFDLGKTTSTEVTQANIDLMNAKKNLAKQIHAYNLALLDYEYSIGIGKGNIY